MVQHDLTRSIASVQQDFALNCGIQTKIIWDALAADQSDILKQKIYNLLPGVDGNGKSLTKLHELIFANVWLQRKYSNGNLLSAIIYVLVVSDALDKPELALDAIKYTCHPVIRIRKCINDDRQSTQCCMIFVDEQARIYENWNDYVNNNLLPSGIMVAPTNGVYTFDANDKVSLLCQATPNRRKKYLKAADVTAIIGSTCLAAPLMLPVAGTAAIGLTIAAMPFAVYSMARSAMHLHDRRTHGQTIALKDSAARSTWLGVIGGAVGIGAIGASGALTLAATNGRTICNATKIAVNGINVSSIVFSGAGMVNGVYDIIMKVHDDEKIETLDVVQLATSLITITHAINNFRIVAKIPTNNRTGASIRRTLTKSIRQLNNRITNNSLPTQDIIRAANNIPVAEILLNLHNIYTALNVPKFGAQFLSDIQAYIHSDDGDKLKLSTLAKHFGSKFTQHIMNELSFLDVMKTMAMYFVNNVFNWFMEFGRSFIADNANAIDTFLNSTISTELILYKTFMYCIENYKIFTIEYLDSQIADIQNHIQTYFESFNPFNAKNAKQNCKVCKGYYYICDL